MDDPKKNKTYSSDVVRNIRFLYVVAAVFWTVLILMLCIPQRGDFIIIVLICIPYLILIFNYFSIPKVSPQMERDVNQGVAVFVSFSSVVILALTNWNEAELGNRKPKSDYFKIVAVALGLLILSFIDIWGSNKQIPLIRQGRSILQAMSITLLIITFYLYFKNTRKT